MPPKEDSENRISKFKRKDWSLSKSQVIAEKAPEPDTMVEKEGGGECENERMDKGKRTLAGYSCPPFRRHLLIHCTVV